MIYRTIGPEGFGAYEVDWRGATPEYRRVERKGERLLIPGFVDVHIHGGFGIDFMSANESDMRALSDRLESKGYEGFLPTTVAAAPDAIRRALASLPNDPRILGFHLEGPFLSPRYPGAQPCEAIRPAGEAEGEEWTDILEDPRLRLATVAPESPGALVLATRLMSRGVVVSMGHSNASYDEARFGFEFGFSHATHLFNAMRPIHHREPGVAGYALLNDHMTAEVIYDRRHVSREALALVLRTKPVESLVAVSDGTAAVGLPNGAEFAMWGHICVKSQGEVVVKATGALAGSAITLLDAFRNIAEDFGEEAAIRTCCLNPRRVLGMRQPPRVLLELNRGLDIVERRALTEGPLGGSST